jgi:hypothetical protein
MSCRRSSSVTDRLLDATLSTVLAVGRVPGRPGRVLHGACSGIWLGVLDDHRLCRLDERFYARDTAYRTEAWNDRGLHVWEQRAIKEAFAPGGRIVVPGCGGGREVLALLESGFDAVGYEPHPLLADYADELLTRRGFPGRAQRMPRDEFVDPGPCDGVLVGWGAYSAIATQERRLGFLTRAVAAIGAGGGGGGGVIVSGFARPAHTREARLTATLANGIRRPMGRPRIELGDALAPSRVHVFTYQSLAGELSTAGLEFKSMRATREERPGLYSVCAIGRAP